MAFKKSKSSSMVNEINFNVLEELGTIGSVDKKGYQLKLRYMSWNGNEPKYDLRKWNDENKCYKGMSFSGEELEELYCLLRKIAED